MQGCRGAGVQGCSSYGETKRGAGFFFFFCLAKNLKNGIE